jgi:hypothetical protein
MNSINAFQKRLRDETAPVQKEIQSHNQQLEALNSRLEGLKRAAELFESERVAIVELLQTGTANGSGISSEMSAAPATKMEKAAKAKATAARKQVKRNAQIGRAKTARNARAASHNGAST